MDLQLKRDAYQANGIFSTITEADSGTQLCVSVDHAYPSGDLSHPHPFMPKVLPGRYLCVRGQHMLHSTPQPFETFEVTSVAGHSGILFHWGNWNEDSDGCFCVGDSLASAPDPHDGGEVEELVTDTREAFARFMQAQEGVNEFYLTVIA